MLLSYFETWMMMSLRGSFLAVLSKRIHIYNLSLFLWIHLISRLVEASMNCLQRSYQLWKKKQTSSTTKNQQHWYPSIVLFASGLWNLCFVSLIYHIMVVRTRRSNFILLVVSLLLHSSNDIMLPSMRNRDSTS